MNRINKLAFTLVFMVLLLGVFSCKEKKKEQPAPEKEKITTVSLDLLAEGKGKQDVSVQFKDNEGVDGKKATSPLRLQANTNYAGKIMLLDESKTSGSDVSSAYTITYQVTGADVTITRTNQQLQVQTKGATTNTDALLRIEMKKNTEVYNVTFPLLISQ